MDSVFFGKFNHAAPSGAFPEGLRPIFAAFRGAPMLPAFGISGLSLRRLLLRWLGSMARGGGRLRGFFGVLVRCWLAGMEAPAALQGCRRGPRRGSGLRPAAWDGFGILRRIQPGCASRRSLAVTDGTSMPRLQRLFTLWSGESGGGAGGRGFRGFFCGLWASRSRGHGSVCGVAWEWAGATAWG